MSERKTPWTPQQLRERLHDLDRTEIGMLGAHAVAARIARDEEKFAIRALLARIGAP